MVESQIDCRQLLFGIWFVLFVGTYSYCKVRNLLLITAEFRVINYFLWSLCMTTNKQETTHYKQKHVPIVYTLYNCTLYSITILEGLNCSHNKIGLIEQSKFRKHFEYYIQMTVCLFTRAETVQVPPGVAFTDSSTDSRGGISENYRNAGKTKTAHFSNFILFYYLMSKKVSSFF